MSTHKGFDRVEVKDADKGLVTAIFSRFNVIDSDRDVTLPHAFTDGAQVRISAYGHTSWEGALPIGIGTIRTTSTEALMDGRFFLDTQGGRDTFTVVKELGPLGEWSYGYDVEESEAGTFQGQQVRFLKKLKVHEVSPVLVGAGVATHTLSAKAADPVRREYERFKQLDHALDAVDLQREFLRFVAFTAGIQLDDPDGT